LKTRRRQEIIAEMLKRAHHGIRREPTQRAERAEFHRVTQILDQRHVRGHIFTRHDALYNLGAAHGADAAGRALAARFEGAELEGETRLPWHVDRVAENPDAAEGGH